MKLDCQCSTGGPLRLCGGRPGQARLSPHVAPDRHTTALQRVLGVVRGEGGKFYLLLEYLGYRYLEFKLESLLVDENSELKRAYREHANTRSSLSIMMLYCAGAILEARWHEQSLRDLGMAQWISNWCTNLKTPDSIS
jgi:hypothetical protein